MKFYHRTTEENWKKIQAEGVLWGIPTPRRGHTSYRYTYLSPEPFPKSFGVVLLEVEYEPKGIGSHVDNYGFDPPEGMVCWQFSVFVPISVDRVKRIE